eukprot:TRINITY_DN1325_c0_g1_i1.p1 TRINITY_DN1325_c0_g1~~TRINITY_DN1325_c0_g1_i1.p1  ORF type:complete len:903 (-),score=354.06 TRINITY_DN1325_c0_g1_i1:76-2784(-)
MATKTLSLLEVAKLLKENIEIRSRSKLLTTYEDCFLGCDGVRYIVENQVNGVSNVIEGVWLCQQLLTNGLFFRARGGKKHFRNKPTLYRFATVLDQSNEDLSLEDIIRMNASELVRQILDPETGIRIRNRRYKFIMYKRCFVGKELVGWLSNRLSIGRFVSVLVGKRLVAEGFFSHVNAERPFADELFLYVFNKKKLIECNLYTVYEAKRKKSNIIAETNNYQAVRSSCGIMKNPATLSITAIGLDHAPPASCGVEFQFAAELRETQFQTPLLSSPANWNATFTFANVSLNPLPPTFHFSLWAKPSAGSTLLPDPSSDARLIGDIYIPFAEFKDNNFTNVSVPFTHIGYNGPQLLVKLTITVTLPDTPLRLSNKFEGNRYASLAAILLEEPYCLMRAVHHTVSERENNIIHYLNLNEDQIQDINYLDLFSFFTGLVMISRVDSELSSFLKNTITDDVRMQGLDAFDLVTSLEEMLVPQIGPLSIKRKENSFQRVNRILQNPKLLGFFRVFLRQIHCEENLECWIEIQRYKALASGVMMKIAEPAPQYARSIVTKYFEEDSEIPVNLPYEVVTRIKTKLGQSATIIIPDLFSTAEEQMMYVLGLDSFAKFESTEVWQELEEMIFWRNLLEPHLQLKNLSGELLLATMQCLSSELLEKVMHPLISQISNNPSNYEIEPSRAASLGLNLSDNVQRMIDLIKRFFDGILNSVAEVPVDIRLLLSHIKTVIERETFTADVHGYLSYFFLIRMIAPVLVCPEFFKFFNIDATKVSKPGTSRGLAIVVMVLVAICTSIFNLSSALSCSKLCFEETHYLAPFNSLVISYRFRFCAYFDSLMQEMRIIPPSLNSEAISQIPFTKIHSLLSNYLPEINSVLDSPEYRNAFQVSSRSAKNKLADIIRVLGAPV